MVFSVFSLCLCNTALERQTDSLVRSRFLQWCLYNKSCLAFLGCLLSGDVNYKSNLKTGLHNLHNLVTTEPSGVCLFWSIVLIQALG